MTLTLELDLDNATLVNLNRRADERGFADAAAYVKLLVELECKPMSRGERAVRRMTQFKSTMTGDELMEFTRSEV